MIQRRVDAFQQIVSFNITKKFTIEKKENKNQSDNKRYYIYHL